MFCCILFFLFLLVLYFFFFFFFFSSRRRHTRSLCDWSSDVCSSDLHRPDEVRAGLHASASRACRHSTRATAASAKLIATRIRTVSHSAVPLQIGRASCRERV